MATETIRRKFEYDHANRMTRTWHSLNSAAPIISFQNEYNELGQLVDKKLHSSDNGATFKQSVDLRYNIRGWTTSINNATLVTDESNDDVNDLFGMNLLYEYRDTGLSNSSQFNGNFSAVKWSRNLALGTVKDQAFIYGYDTLNRIKSAAYKVDSVTWANPTGKFNESGYKYDLNGNILSLLRKASNGSTMDNLSYAYGSGDGRSNRLLSVSDAGNITQGFKDGNVVGNDYNYDPNGNITADKNKNITKVIYNLMNLPDTVIKSTGEYIRYTYNAAGRKLMQQVFSNSNALTKSSEYLEDLYLENDTLKFINHEEGRIVLTNSVAEYQYHLKDHLGNVRLTFTTKKDSVIERATLETANLTTEEGQFLNLDNIRRVNSRIFDHTNDGTSSASAYSNRLSGIATGGSTREEIGMAKSISVMPGDKIDLSVFVKYVDASDPGTTTALLTLVNAIAAGTAPGGTVVDGAGYSTFSASDFPLAGLLERGDESGSVPKAYLNWLVFNRNFVPMLDQSGFKRVSGSAEEDGTTISVGNPEGRPHEELTGSINVTEPGYIYVWVSNDNEIPVEVYFDDLTVKHVKSPVVQMDDYYPFGLTFNSYRRENSVFNKYQFGEKELQDDLSLNWLDFGARLYMPDIGRWGSIDPLAEKTRSWSPYNYAFNNPIKFNDPSGKEVKEVKDVKEYSSQHNYIVVTYNAKTGSNTVTQVSSTSSGKFQTDAKGNKTFVETSNMKITAVTLSKSGGVMSTSQSTTKSEKISAVRTETQLDLFGSNTQVNVLSKTLSNVTKTTPEKYDPSDKLDRVAQLSATYQRINPGGSLANETADYLMNMTENPGFDEKTKGAYGTVAAALYGLSTNSVLYYDEWNGNVLVNNTYDKPKAVWRAGK